MPMKNDVSFKVGPNPGIDHVTEPEVLAILRKVSITFYMKDDTFNFLTSFLKHNFHL